MDGVVHLKSDVRAAGNAVEQKMFCRKECGGERPRGEGRGGERRGRKGERGEALIWYGKSVTRVKWRRGDARLRIDQAKPLETPGTAIFRLDSNCVTSTHLASNVASFTDELYQLLQPSLLMEGRHLLHMQLPSRGHSTLECTRGFRPHLSQGAPSTYDTAPSILQVSQ